MSGETEIKPPTFPLVAQLNQVVTDFVFDAWAKKNLRGYTVVKTSGLRTAEHNAEVGGAANSAHVHGLAVDFGIFKDGKRLAPAAEHQVFNQVVAPTWPGYAQDEIDSKNHIHVNLTREITPSMTLATFSVLGIVGVALWKSLFHTEGKG